MRRIEGTTLRGEKAVIGRTIILSAIFAAPAAGLRVISGAQMIVSGSSNCNQIFDSKALTTVKYLS